MESWQVMTQIMILVFDVFDVSTLPKFQGTSIWIAPSIRWKAWISVNWVLTVYSFNSEVFALGTLPWQRSWLREAACNKAPRASDFEHTQQWKQRKQKGYDVGTCFSIYKIHLCHVIKKWPWNFLTCTSSQSKKWLPNLKYLQNKARNRRILEAARWNLTHPCTLYFHCKATGSLKLSKSRQELHTQIPQTTIPSLQTA